MKKSSINRNIDRIIDLALVEDIGKGDITTNIFIPPKKRAKARMIAHEKATIAGLDVVKKVFKRLDKNAIVRPFFKDGDIVRPGKKLIEIEGNARALLTAERVALNFLSHLSAIATNTTAFINKIRPLKTEIVDTRKTTPGFRALEKMAIRSAKGVNHRLDLSEMVLVKDNHHLLSHLSVTEMIAKARKMTKKPVGIEIENLKDFKEAWRSKPCLILLDNMGVSDIKKAVDFAKKDRSLHKPALEVSGGINLKNVRSVAKTGIERISIGALTHSKKTVNISMEIHT